MKDVRVIIRMMVLCNVIVITKQDRRRLGLPNAQLDINMSTTVIAINI